MTNALPLSLNLDRPPLPTGWRDYVVMPGRKWALVVLLATGESARITMEELEAAMTNPRDLAASRRRLAKRLRANAVMYGNDKSTAVKRALVALRSPGTEGATKP